MQEEGFFGGGEEGGDVVGGIGEVGDLDGGEGGGRAAGGEGERGGDIVLLRGVVGGEADGLVDVRP